MYNNYCRWEKGDNRCASGSVGRAQPCQGWGRGFESRLALLMKKGIIPKGMVPFLLRVLPDSDGSRSTLRSGPRSFYLLRKFDKFGLCQSSSHALSCVATRMALIKSLIIKIILEVLRTICKDRIFNWNKMDYKLGIFQIN